MKNGEIVYFLGKSMYEEKIIFSPLQIRYVQMVFATIFFLLCCTFCHEVEFFLNIIIFNWGEFYFYSWSFNATDFDIDM